MRHRVKGTKRQIAKYRSAPPLFEFFRGVTYAGVLAVFGVAISILGLKVNDFWDPATSITLSLLRTSFFWVLATLAYRWVYATHIELGYWLEWLDYIQEPEEVYGAMLLLCVVLGLLLALAHDPVKVTALLSIAVLLNYWTQWLADTYFENALCVAEEKYKGIPAHEKAFEIMEYFWIKLPQLPRIVTSMFFSCVAFGFALAGKQYKDDDPKQIRWYIAAYILLISNILISEVVLFVWRSRLRSGIEAARLLRKDDDAMTGGNAP